MLQLRTILYTKVNKKGFTLAELLVVVAIIAILVAVSIPIFSGKLEEARKNTDLANVRAAKASAVVEYLTDDIKDPKYWRFYDADNGIIKTRPNKIKGYNQREEPEQEQLDKPIKPKQGIVQVMIEDKDGKLTVTANWCWEKLY
ncbi:MAG: prepilin-type N-terminal cleavage/methylation domain-containing protein [Anaerovoracaceae bacterium]